MASTATDPCSHRHATTGAIADFRQTTDAMNFGAGIRGGTLLQFPTTPLTCIHDLWGGLFAHIPQVTGQVTGTASERRIIAFAIQLSELASDSWAIPGDLSAYCIDCRTYSDEQVSSGLIASTTVNLGDPVALERMESQIVSLPGPKIFLSAGVLERLSDPRPFLRVLRRLLKRCGESRAVFATIEREHAAEELDEIEVQRLWSADEVWSFLQASGFHLLSRRLEVGDRVAAVLTEIECCNAHYAAFLQASGLPSPTSRLVLAFRDLENPAAARINHHIFELSHLNKPPPVVLTAGGPFCVPSSRWIRAESLCEWSERRLLPNAILEAVLQLTFIYDGLKTIEYQDYGGAFFCVSQAKRAGLLPPSVMCVVICHGNNFSVERLDGQFQSPERNLTHVWEKIVVECADYVLFPSRFLKQLYLETLRLRPLGESIVRGLPLTQAFAPRPLSCPPQPPHTIVFLGPRRSGNGWNEFQRAVEDLCTELPSHSLRLRRVVAVAEDEGDNDRTRFLPSGVAIEEWNRQPTEIAAIVRELAPTAIAVLPGWHPDNGYDLGRAIEVHCPVIVLKGGNLEELIPPRFRDDVLCAKRSGDILEKLRHALSLSATERLQQATALAAAVRSEQERVNAWWSDHASKALRFEPCDEAASPVSVVVPIYNRPFGEIGDLIDGINSQTLHPREVIFVDDASQENFADAHAETIRAQLRVPARFIRHSQNKGLAGARNTGVAAVETPYVALHDSDNVALSDFLYRGCLALQANPSLGAVTFTLTRFTDTDEWRRSDPRRSAYLPIGDGVVVSFSHANWLGDAMGVYRVSMVRELQGWDDSDRTMWEDLAFFMKMISAAKPLMNIPRPHALYRVRPDSMLRTESQFDARLRLARSVRGLPVFEALCLQRFVIAPAPPSPPSSPPPPPIEIERKLAGRQHLRAAIVLLLARVPILHKSARVIRLVVRRVHSVLALATK